ncbi:hypothetical protein ESCOMMO224M_21790 [Escherichia coli]|jgi:putative DNA-invertase from lambdoid prophage Rac
MSTINFQKQTPTATKHGLTFLLILSALMAVTSLSTDIYLPAMPMMAKDLQGDAELTITGFLIRVHCLALGGVDLTSPAGKMTMQVISAVAEFERDLLLERTYSGIARAKAAGKRFGRPPILSEEQKQTVTERLNAGISISAIAREFNTTRQTILRVKAGLLQE